MNDDEKLVGVGLPMFGRILLSPEEASAGVPEDSVSDSLPENLAAGLAEAAGSGEVEAEEAAPETPAASTATETPAAATPAAPATPETTDWKSKYEEAEKTRNDEVLRLAARAFDEERSKFASQSPAHYKMVYGQDPPAGTFPPDPAKPVDPNAPQPNALEQKLAKLEQWQAQQERAAAERVQAEKYQAVVTERAKALTEATQKHTAIFDHPVIGDAAMKLLTNEFISRSADPKAKVDPVGLTAEVAKLFSSYAEHEKAKQVQAKVVTAAKIPAGAGPAGGRQPGERAPEIDFSTRRGRAMAAKQMAQAASVEIDE